MQSKIIPNRKIFSREYLLNFVPGSTQICVETWVNSLKTPKTFLMSPLSFRNPKIRLRKGSVPTVLGCYVYIVSARM